MQGHLSGKQFLKFRGGSFANKELEEFAIMRVNVGEMPAGCIAQLVVRETANLPQFSHLRDEC